MSPIRSAHFTRTRVHKVGRVLYIVWIASEFLPNRASNISFPHENNHLWPIFLVNQSWCTRFSILMRNAPRKTTSMYVKNSENPGYQLQAKIKKDSATFQYNKAETGILSSGARDNLEDETVANKGSSCDRTLKEGHELIEHTNPQSASNVVHPQNATEILELVGTSLIRIRQLNVRSLFAQKHLQ